ncbi:complex I subunit 4 family protein [Paractinoplanes atraurantiacus]|uniref:NADH-quinone oxidoreductase subunit M n=1 Tax=Paractinoplanes atraurantiacus TaxID=1036182 RepID=A0A285IVR3_9ACTN|nr:NADH-quinone oxidoreductase subunit M [Actinoplanes atraurantiacus]SNY52084.1 NADH-quinone oxidoreductase subunit M [Actinoplanes atraurantiacus]
MTIYQVALVAVVALPALGAAVVALLKDRTARLVGTGFAAVTLLPIILLPFARSSADGGLWTEVDVSWVSALNLDFHLGVDGVSYPLVALTGLLTVLCTAYLQKSSGRALTALLLVLEAGIAGTFLSFDLILFFLFFEVVLLPMYAVIAGWGGEDRRRAARKFVLYTLFGSVFLLLGVVTVAVSAGTGDLAELAGGAGLDRTTQYAAFTLLAIAFAVKAPLWPLHTWLPDAHTQAPTVGSVILAGVLLKMGTYGLVRVGVGVAPLGAEKAAPVLGILAVAAILAGSLICLRQTELKRLIAYSSVGHMGFVLLGIATLSETGLQAALLGNVAHGLITGLLFFLAGAIKDRAHTGELSELGGLRETAPRLAGVLGFAAIASLGLPGLAGFWGEAFAVVAAVQRGGGLWTTLAVLAAIGGALTAAYFLRLLRRVTHGPARVPATVASTALAPGANGHLLPGVTTVEWLAWSPLAALTLAVGLAPALVLIATSAPVRALTEALP